MEDLHGGTFYLPIEQRRIKFIIALTNFYARSFLPTDGGQIVGEGLQDAFMNRGNLIFA